MAQVSTMANPKAGRKDATVLGQCTPDKDLGAVRNMAPTLEKRLLYQSPLGYQGAGQGLIGGQIVGSLVVLRCEWVLRCSKISWLWPCVQVHAANGDGGRCHGCRNGPCPVRAHLGSMIHDSRQKPPRCPYRTWICSGSWAASTMTFSDEFADTAREPPLPFVD